jgi:hypothetical protein
MGGRIMRAERGDREGEGTLVVEIRERELGWQVGPYIYWYIWLP